MIMAKIVHFDGGKRDYYGKYRLLSYCEGLNLNPHTREKDFLERTTIVKSRVTCKNCLNKLGIKPNVEVDEQKRRWAEGILEDHISHDRECRRYCVFCDRFIDEEAHHEECIVLDVKKYLDGLEGK